MGSLTNFRKKLMKILKNPYVLFAYATKFFDFRFLSDKKYIKWMFRGMMGKPLNLNNPQTYNEKLQWLKLYDRKPEYTIMADKYAVRDIIRTKIGEEYLIPLIGVWNSAEEIDFDSLPNQFVLKCTHDSKSVIICKNKKTFDIEAAKEKLTKAMKRNYFYEGRQWSYKNIIPRVIAEQYIKDDVVQDLIDYKFFAFDGIVKAIFVVSDRDNPSEESKYDFLDMDFNRLDLVHGHPNSKILPQKPKNLEQMVELAGILSKDLPQARIDFYEVNGRVYFGEITFFHASGMVPFEPEKWDKIFGDWITLPT